MKTFILNIRSEILKTKRTAAIWLSIISGMFVPVLICIICLLKPDTFFKMFQADPWWQYMLYSWEGAVPFLFPMYVILLCSMIVQIEYRNGTWKQVYASPRSYFDIYFTKFIVVLLLVLFSLITFNLTLVSGGYIISMINSKYRFIDSLPPFWNMIKLTGNIFGSILAICALQYWMAFRFRNFVVSFGLGFAVMITSFIIHSWDKAHYIPYLYPSQALHNQMFGIGASTSDTLTNSAIAFTVFLLLGFADMVYKKEKA